MQKVVMIIAVLLLGLGVVEAQNSQQQIPLAKMLTLVPDTPATRSFIYYADYQAMDALRGIPRFTTQELLESQDNLALWGATRNGFIAPFWFSTDHLLNLDEAATIMPELVGFSILDVDYSLAFGDLSSNGMFLKGRWDTKTVQELYQLHGFSENSVGNLSFWCSSTGCDAPSTLPSDDKFQIERQVSSMDATEPVAFMDNYLLNGSGTQTFADVAAVQSGEKPSIINVPDYEAMLETITNLAGDGDLIEIRFYNPVDLSTSDLSQVPSKERAEQYVEALGELPPYSLAALALFNSKGNQLTALLLVYPDETSASTAAETLLNRIEIVRSPFERRRFRQILEERGAFQTTIEPTVQQASSANRYVMILPFVTSVPLNETIIDNATKSYRGMGLVFRVIYQDIEYDTDWLATNFILPQ